MCGDGAHDARQSLISGVDKDGDELNICNFCVIWALAMMHYSSNNPQNPSPRIVVYRGYVSMRSFSDAFMKGLTVDQMKFNALLRACRNAEPEHRDLPMVPSINVRSTQCASCLQWHPQTPLLIMGRKRRYLCNQCIGKYASLFGVDNIMNGTRATATLPKSVLELARTQWPDVQVEEAASTELHTYAFLFARELV